MRSLGECSFACCSVPHYPRKPNFCVARPRRQPKTSSSSTLTLAMILMMPLRSSSRCASPEFEILGNFQRVWGQPSPARLLSVFLKETVRGDIPVAMAFTSQSPR